MSKMLAILIRSNFTEIKIKIWQILSHPL